AQNLLISLSSSALVAPSYFLNPANNVNYTVVVKTPLERIRSVPGLLSTPLTPPVALAQAPGPTLPTPPAQTLSNVAALSPQVSANQLSHYTVQRVLDVAANVEGRDLGAVARDIERKIAGLGKLPKGMRVQLRGQNEVMTQSFRSL